LTELQDKWVNLLETEVFSIIVSMCGFVLNLLFVPRWCNSFFVMQAKQHAQPVFTITSSPALIFCYLSELPVRYEITWV
jgi:hypothetical protein